MIMAPTFTTLPSEIIHNILVWVDPQDLGRIAQTCHGLDVFMKGDKHLFKEIYCRFLVKSRGHLMLLIFR